MELVKPDIGLLFWMTTCFILLLFIMRKYAWGPILKALNEREQVIQSALEDAEEAQKQISEAASKVEKMLEEGKKEKENMIKAAQLELSEYKKEQEKKIGIQIQSKLEAAKEDIGQQKRAALEELKRAAGTLSIEIAKKILQKELENESQHDMMIKQSINELEIK
jgi:F-type H+-transporting ATPase subunit b